MAQPSEFKPSVQPREAPPPRRPAPPPPPEPADDVVSALERLAGLHKSGALTAEEFEAAKRRVLGGRR